ncbi:MAG: hypothetical protein ACREAB_05435 [Blastocatellia bacterium]
MFSKFKKLLGSGASTRVIKTNLDGLSEEEQKNALYAITQHSDIPTHSGDVEHGYSLARVSNPAKCPRCAAPTELRYADFIYATQKGSRIMMAPAGHFCTRCPTVIVDEDLLRQGVSRNFVYRSVIGIECEDKKKGGPFKTWNGKETVVFFDEVEDTMELLTKDMLALPPGRASTPSKQKGQRAARRREIARQSRKQNRRKR